MPRKLKLPTPSQLHWRARCPGCPACRKPDPRQLELATREPSLTRAQRLGQLELEYVRRLR